jgi:hypothetical protein
MTSDFFLSHKSLSPLPSSSHLRKTFQPNSPPPPQPTMAFAVAARAASVARPAALNKARRSSSKTTVRPVFVRAEEENTTSAAPVENVEVSASFFSLFPLSLLTPPFISSRITNNYYVLKAYAKNAGRKGASWAS